MCAGAIGWAQVGRVVWGADDPKKGYRRYSEAVFHPKTTVVRGILGGECEALMTSFSPGYAIRPYLDFEKKEKKYTFASNVPANRDV